MSFAQEKEAGRTELLPPMEDDEFSGKTGFLLARHGAVPGQGIDAAVAAHYGAPSQEWRKLEEGKAFVDLGHMEIVKVTGPDRLVWLHSLVSQHLENLAPGSSTEALIFDPTGHVQSAFFVYDDGTSTYLITDVGGGKELADFLDSMKFMLRVEVELCPELKALGGFMDAEDKAVNAWEKASIFVWEDPWPSLAQGGATYTLPGEEHPAREWKRVIGVVNNVEEAVKILEKSGLSPAGMLAWEASRIAAWRPRGALEAAGRVLPHELDWLRTAVHLHKGCYRGQETVAKLVNLGRPPRRLVELYLEGPVGELPAPGTPVFFGEKEAGVVTSSCLHPEEGPIALALVKRVLPLDTVLSVGNFQAGQRVIVNPEGKSSATPEKRPGAEFRKRM